MAAMVFGTMALAFDAYFSDAAGKKIGSVWEGQYVYIDIKDPEKGACGIDQFTADLIIFDAKTGAYVGATKAYFRELGGIGSGLYFWVTGDKSNTKVAVQVGSRFDFSVIPEGMTHVLGSITPFVVDTGGVATPDWRVAGRYGWTEGAWEYVDEALLSDTPPNPVTFDGVLPAARTTARVNFEGLGFTPGSTNWPEDLTLIFGRFENMDTLVLIVLDNTDERNIDQDQVKIVDTVVKFKVEPKNVQYGCGAGCANIVVTIEDPDENLNPNEIEYVPVFVIINPGSWNPTEDAPVTNFCSLMMYGGNYTVGSPYNEPIRWYNIYEPERYIDYSNAPWWNAGWVGGTAPLLKAVFFAAETGVNTGVFKLDLGNLEDFQEALWGTSAARNYKLPPGTTIAFYYIDPNDFDDMDLATIQIGNRPLSQVFITDANGVPLTEVRLGAGWGGLYIRVYDADANVEACCPDKVVVHICDPHNEDDSEYVVLEEISNNSGIFFTQVGIPLLPVWDAVGGYQLVFDDWKIQAFNEDTIFVRYNSVDYLQDSLNTLGNGDPNTETVVASEVQLGYDIDGDETLETTETTTVFAFPPVINAAAARNQYWDVSFAKVKVYDFQVFDGTTHHMRFLDGNYQPVTEIPVSGSLYLEVTDLDQNEHPMMRELIFGGWNKDAVSGDDAADEDSDPIWGDDVGILNAFLTNVYTGSPNSITGIPPTVKIFMFNAQRGTWERIDLRETAVGSGVFRSTTCVLVSDSRFPGQGNLGSKAGDTIMAFYQDPSNHSDIAIISIKVSEGGAGAVTPPTVALSVAFDRTTYYPGDTVTITVTDEQYAGAAEIVGTNVLVLLDKDGGVITSWNKLEAVAGQPGKFRVTYVLPETVKLGTITAKYTDPYMPTRTAQAQATVVAKALTNVTGITVSPNPFKTSTTFTIQAEPAGAVAAKITIAIYDLTGAKVAELTGTNTASVTWTGGNLRNGAYIYVATVEGAGKTFGPFKGFVYIER